jgi:hypothetical protein
VWSKPGSGASGLPAIVALRRFPGSALVPRAVIIVRLKSTDASYNKQVSNRGMGAQTV